MRKGWKVFGIIILALTAALILFDMTVWIVYKIESNQRREIFFEAREAGYPNCYTICERQENIVIDGNEYLVFHAHRPVIIDGDYHEDLVASPDDEFEDLCPDENENLELWAKELDYVRDESTQNSYTYIDLYRVSRHEVGIAGDWCWRAIGVTILVVPVIFVTGLVWLIHFVWYRWKKSSEKKMDFK